MQSKGDRTGGYSRNLEEGETELKPNEKSLLDLICKAYYLPQWCSLNDYRRIFEAEGLQVNASTLKDSSFRIACI